MKPQLKKPSENSIKTYCTKCQDTICLADLTGCAYCKGLHSSSQLHCDGCALSEHGCQICGCNL